MSQPSRARKLVEAAGALPMLASAIVFWFSPALAAVLFLVGLPIFVSARAWKWWVTDD